MTHLELFAGIGGFRRAMQLLEQIGGPDFRCVGYSEIDDAARTTYKANFETEGEIDIGDIEPFSRQRNLRAVLPGFDLLTGGFPCQSFSMMGEQRGFGDDRGNLFFSMLRIISAKRPRFVLLENVKNLKTHDSGRTYATIVDRLNQLGYQVFSDIFNSSDFGLAQTRNRIYIFATLAEIEEGFSFDAATIRDSFVAVDTPNLEHQESVSDVLVQNAPDKYWLSDRIKPTILSCGTGGFKAKSEIDLPIARPLCATMAKMHRACQDNYYSERFIRSQGRRPGPRKGRAAENIRKLMPMEALLLQGFSREFYERAANAGLSDGKLYKQAGNAVSVNVVFAILNHLSNSFNWR